MTERQGTSHLARQEWFHGFRPRADVEALLREKGDFLVRCRARCKGADAILSVHTGVKVEHLSVLFDRRARCWDLGFLRKSTSTPPTASGAKSTSATPDKTRPRFKNIVDLIKHYKNVCLLPPDVRLSRAIRRPPWMIADTMLKLEPGAELGRGNFAVVVRATLSRRGQTSVPVAVKKLLERPEEEKGEFESAFAQLFREANILSRFCHPNLLTFYGVCCDRPPVMVVVELCTVSLEAHLVREGECVRTPERVLFTVEVARGLAYMHAHSVLHRDLATRNCLIAANGVVKISDLGLSQTVEQGQQAEVYERNSCVPLRWMAPETLQRTPRYSTKSDMWAFGVLMYEVFNLGVKPWPNELVYRNISRAIKAGNMPAPPTRTPPEVAQLMKTCWSLEPETRPSADAICARLVALQRTVSSLATPSARECSTRKVAGVTRMEPADEQVHKSITDLLPPAPTTTTTCTTTTSTSEESVYTGRTAGSAERSTNATATATTPNRSDSRRRSS